MKQFFTRILLPVVLVMSMMPVYSQQLPDSGFEDWSGTAFDGNAQMKNWNASNVEQVGFKFNFITKEKGRSGNCAYIANKEVGAMGITQTSPGYFTLGTPWQYLPGITSINQATGGTDGGLNFSYRPDSMYVWIKRAGSNVRSENYSILFYSWKGESKGTSYKANKANSCTSTSHTNEESDIRQALDANTCGTSTKATQVAEGFFFEMKEYSSWTQIKVPIYYFNDEVPAKCNVIFSAAGYPNFRNSAGIYDGDGLYVDDVELIYSSKIQQLYIGGKVWNGFDPNSSEEQIYSVGNTNVVPDIYAVRGAGTLSNIAGNKVTLPGRKLTDSEMTITKGQVDGTPTVITVKSADGKSTTTYKIKMVKAKSTNATLNSILVNGEPINGFNPQLSTYDVKLPYGTTAAPVVAVIQAEDKQTVAITQATSPNGKATIVVTAEDGTTKRTYTLNFSIAPLDDNTLQGIKVNGQDVPDFTPSTTTYRVELPLGTTTMPKVEAVSKYPAGAQTISYEAPTQIEGQYKISVSTPGNPTPKVYKLNFKITASSNNRLKDLVVEGYDIDFNPNSRNYFVSLNMGTTVQPKITWVQGDEYQTVTPQYGGVDGTTTITVKAANGDEMVYRITFSVAKSSISYLNSIKLNGEVLVDANGKTFDKDTYSYTVILPTGTNTIPAITYEQGDEFQTVEVKVAGVNATTRIFVTAGDGQTSLYEIYFSAVLSDVSTLKSISVGGVELADFAPDKLEYTVELPQGTTSVPVISYELQEPNTQTATMRNGGLNADTRITVTSQTGTKTIYILRFVVTTSSNTKLASVTISGLDDFVFDPDKREYDIVLPEGVSQVPSVAAEPGEPSQRLISTLEGTDYTIRVISESGAQDTYIFRFTIQKSENAFLRMIYLDSVPLQDFDSLNLNYEVVLATATCPAITVDKDPSQHVLITSPKSTGVASIVVTPESGAPNTYTIEFTSTVKPVLEAIYVDGQLIDDYRPNTYEYEIEYSGILPVITYSDSDAGKKVTQIDDVDETRLYLEVNGLKATYHIRFKLTASSDASLMRILLDKKPLSGFSPTKLTYEVAMPASGIMPKVTYVLKDKNLQHVVEGQTAQNAYSITVVAENGAHQTYTINFTTEASNDTKLTSVKLDGTEVTFDAENKSTQSIEPGKDLPELTYKKTEGQSVVSAQTGDDQQQLVVVAENGDAKTYTVNYDRTTVDNALLGGIHILQDEEWKPLKGFAEDKFDYAINLPLGSAVAPCVWPIAGKPGQVITVNYGNANGETTIHVKSQNNEEQTYTLHFSVEKSSNTKLGSLIVNEQDMNVDETEYQFEVEFGTTNTYDIKYEKAEDSQLIEYHSEPITGTTRIIVTAENGDKRTYSFSYKIAETVGENILKQIEYTYVEAGGELIKKSFAPVKGTNTIELPYGATAFDVTGYTKNFDEQAVTFYNGGIRRGAKLIVSANRNNTEDVTYEVVPKLPEFDTKGKLSDLKFNNVTIANFKPYVYNYMVNVTAEPKASDFTCEAYGGVKVTASALDKKTKQIKFTVTGGETYSVCWYYTQYGNPFDFSGDWVKATNNGYKPNASWTVPGDCADAYQWGFGAIKFDFKTGNEVMSTGNGVLLQTVHGASLSGSVPGMMTTGTMSLSLNSSGNSTSSITESASKGIEFKNTPEQITLTRKELANESVTGWSFRLRMSDGSNLATKTEFSGTYSEINQAKSETKAINYPSNPVTRFTATFNAAHTENASDLDKGFGGTIYTSTIQFTDIRFIYNSELKSMTINGQSTVQKADSFIYELKADEEVIGLPVLKVVGKVPDQTQVIRWQNGGEWKNGKLIARVTNFGENSTDSTVYYAVLKRKAVSTLDYTISFGGYPTFVAGDTTYVNMPFATTAMPDIAITPASMHQLFDIRKSGKNVIVTVSDETGASKTKVYSFRELKNSNAKLEAINASGLTPAFSDDVFEYTIQGLTMPKISFSKPKTADEKEMGQTAVLQTTADGASIVVTSADGKATNTYHIAFTRVLPESQGSLYEITVENTATAENVRIDGFLETKYDYTQEYSDHIGFARKEIQPYDTVREVLTDEYMSITVIGVGESEGKTYTITYPTEASSNADLGKVLVNGETYVPFNPLQTEIDPYESDEPVEVVFVLSEPGQKMEISITGAAGAPARAAAAGDKVMKFTVKITAANGTDTKTYTFTVLPERSATATLAGITVAGEPIEDFSPERFTYTYEIESTTPKLVQPNLPKIGYTLGQESQTVEVVPAGKIGEATSIFVTSEDGTETKEYKVVVTSSPSHNSELSNILVNGYTVSGFKPSRTYYSIQVLGTERTIDFAKSDPFQTVIETFTETGKQLEVIAEDGMSTTIYEIEIYTKAKSNNANLANILFNNLPMDDYAAQHGIDGLTFKEKTYSYTIPLMKTDTMPDISARLQEDAQKIEVQTKSTDKGVVKTLHVTAEDGLETNDYELLFAVEKSANTALGMLFVNGDSLRSYDMEEHTYYIPLAIGERRIPAVDYAKSETMQAVVATQSPDGLRTDLLVTAENGSTATYSVIFSYTYSQADTLQAIYANDTLLIDGFRPDVYYYSYTLPMGVRTLPTLEFVPGDNYQLPQLIDTIATKYRTTYQCHVSAEDSLHTKTYTVVYEIQPSDVDTLQSIRINNRAFEAFDPQQTEYAYILPKGTTEQPVVLCEPGDSYQDTLSTFRDNVYTMLVTAENGHSRTYTIRFENERDNDATLSAILLGGKPYENFDPEKTDYTIYLPYGTTEMPLVTYTTKPGQKDAMRVEDGAVLIDVVAEDGVTKQTYTLRFQEAPSTNAALASISIDGELLEGFHQDTLTYTITLPYGTTDLPEVTAVLADTAATMEIVKSGTHVAISTTSPDEEHYREYEVIFVIERCAVNYLKDLLVKGQTLEGFHPDTTFYTIAYPVGTDSTSFIHAADITYVLGDTTETVTINENNGEITVTVMAQNGTPRVYAITQVIKLSDNSRLADILLDDESISGFADSVFSYNYLLLEGAVMPDVMAIPQDSLATVDITPGTIGETPTVIFCTAQDGTETKYYIHFTYSSINTAKQPRPADVLFKQLPGEVFMAYSIRANTSIAVYDQYGHLMFMQNLPVCDPNDVTVITDPTGREQLVDANGDGAMFRLPQHGQTFFYVFYTNDVRITSGKFLVP